MSSLNTHYGAAEIAGLLGQGKSVFFVGIGGIHMSSLAMLTLKEGHRVGGSDRTKTALTERLEAAGVQVFYTHEAQHVDGYDVIVFTVAVPEDNPELCEAKRQNKPVISRADYLGYLMSSYRHRIGISGMHGKSTTTSMCAQVFIDCKTDPTVVSGAEMKLMDGAFAEGSKDKDYFLFEACEYMDSFLDFTPTLAVVLNLEMDHVDYFKNMEQVSKSFASFVDLTQQNATEGLTIYNKDDQWVLRAMQAYTGRSLTFSMYEGADYYPAHIIYERGFAEFDVMEKDSYLCHVALKIPGMHNVYNALAAVAAARVYGLPGEEIGAALTRFEGARRRMEYKGKFLGADVYDDYGHHPTEVRTTLKGASDMGYREVWCVYQPHTYSRTAVLYNQFTEAFNKADHVLMTDIYAAREANVFGVSSERLARDIGNKAIYCDSIENAKEYLEQHISPDDLILVMGAGDIYKIFKMMGL